MEASGKSYFPTALRAELVGVGVSSSCKGGVQEYSGSTVLSGGTCCPRQQL